MSMNQILEVFGRGVTVNIAELITKWLCEYRSHKKGIIDCRLDQMISLLSEDKIMCQSDPLQVYLFSNPTCIYGRLVLVVCALRERDLALAVQELLMVYRKQPNNTVCLYALGFCHELLGQESKAIEFYQDCLKFKMHLQLPLQRLAAIYIKNGNYDRAIEHYEQLKKLFPEDLSSHIILGHIYATAEDYSNAISTFNSAILLHPDSMVFMDVNLEELINENEFHDALDYIDTQLSIFPGRADLLAKKADVLSMLSETDEAISMYSQALNMCPDFLDVAVKLGTLYMKNGNLMPAADLFMKAMEINDQITDAYLGLASSHLQSRDTNGALAALCSASMILPNSVLLFSETARLVLNALYGSTSMGDLMEEMDETILDEQSATEAHQAQITMQPGNPAPYYRLGLLRMRTEGPHAAQQEFRKALDISPTFSRANTKLLLCMYGLGDNRAALEQLNLARKINSEHMNLYYQTALLYSDRVKFASSLLNMSKRMSDHFVEVDYSSQIAIILESVGITNRSDILWEGLQETLAGARGILGK